MKKKFDDRRLSDYIRSAIGQHRKTMSALDPADPKSYKAWPFIKHVDDWIAATKGKLGNGYSKYADQEAILRKFVSDNKDLVCKACSGFGHTTDDYKCSKSRKRVKGCPTQDYIDPMYKFLPVLEK